MARVCRHVCRIGILYDIEVELWEDTEKDMEDVEDEAIEKALEQLDKDDYEDAGAHCWVELESCREEG